MMDGERISIQIEERFRETVQTRLGLSLLSAALTGVLVMAAGPAAAPLALIPLGVYAAFRRGHRRRIETTERQLERLADQLVQALEAGD